MGNSGEEENEDKKSGVEVWKTQRERVKKHEKWYKSRVINGGYLGNSVEEEQKCKE